MNAIKRNCFLFGALIFLLMLTGFHVGIFNALQVQCTESANSTTTSTTPPTANWNRTYGGSGDDVAFSVIQKSDNGYTVAGHTNSFGSGNDDFWLLQTDSNGQMLWNKTYGGSGYEGAFAMTKTIDNGYALAGDIKGPGSLGWDFWLVKTDANGTELFNRKYGGAGDEGALCLIQARDGGYVLAGDTKPTEGNVWDLWIIKTDDEGNMLWNVTCGGEGDDAAFSIAETADGGYAIAGRTSSFGNGGYDFWLLKTDSSGTLQWNRTYGGTGDDETYSVIQTKDGGLALAGNTKSFGFGGYDFWLVRTDATGDILWNKTYGGTNDEGVFSMIQTTDFGLILSGNTGSFGAGNNDFWIVKTSRDGEMVWNETCGGSKDDVAFSVVQTADGGLALAGDTKSYGAGSWDFWLVKLSPASETVVSPWTGFGIEVAIVVVVSAIIAGIIISWIAVRKRKQKLKD